ncbi:MAG: hypothetical protein KAY24_05255 [Candidatus Eisenbacteria sp.]|nr:hypothetical protein [Candidatus Eisenbacteria bacterium]
MKTMDSIVKMLVAVVIGSALLQHDALAQWHPRTEDLPGITSDSELMTYAVIASGGLLCALLISMPKADVHLKGSEIGSANLQSLVDRTAGPDRFSLPMRFKHKSGKRSTDYGVIRSVGTNKVVIETRADSVGITYTNLKDIMDLESAAIRAQRQRMRTGTILAGLAAAAFYDAAIADHPIEGGSRALSWGLFGAFGGLAAHSFIHKSGEEKEHRIWRREFVEHTPH